MKKTTAGEDIDVNADTERAPRGETLTLDSAAEMAFRLMYQRQPTAEDRAAGIGRLVRAALGARREARPS